MIQTTSPLPPGRGISVCALGLKKPKRAGWYVRVAPARSSQKVHHPTLTSVGVFTSLASYHFKYTRFPRRNDFHCWNAESLLE